jgi:hypothetical protein
VGLAAIMIGGIGGVAAYGRQTNTLQVKWQPISCWRYWRVGKRPRVLVGCSRNGSIGVLLGHTYSLGFVEVEVPHRGPEVILWNTHKASTRGGASP